jgi:hypothetical protein
MTEDRANKLDDIGFCWDTNEATWLDRLREFKVRINNSGGVPMVSIVAVGCTHAVVILFPISLYFSGL